ncbi:alanine/glycine:cation symporter family protein [Pseudarthrobacter chlorophenolicus]|uniref:Amino acid carrier protein n=1 Tax=Pseudarthrobacter chlorophenolicus (strain ATCC 700700 / DSM 12829 / CIP 107037 / JCM 12360 / KCTC 9906 / NCIMB 13794 / A6) TaxID=452863 RepID=B8H6L5_PSECP|nr:alanine/glycine:cation symporter family protein [Pseudarthrobacter chlorophenolicus]ACL41541.1 amino acid carrier protein [Pseudarthrobacter chlorophenolicus A6]SDQ62388.1 alanine or glycine:cation symporter, AGCS family [Pseudarthrobacter chlorophenolicus]
MDSDFGAFLSTVSDAIWAPMAYVVLGLGVAYSIATKGIQFRRIPDMLRQLKDSEGGEGGLSSFQALVLALASRVGVGSIAGVATAVGAGGPGALVWMAITGLVGCTVGYAEAALSQTFKRQVQDEDRRNANEDIGGMPYYIKYGLKLPKVGALVAVLGVIGYGFVFPGLQVNTIAATAKLAFGLDSWIPAILVTVLIALVIFGGTGRLVKVTQALVPVLAIGYLVLALAVIAINFGSVPAAVALIFQSAIGIHPLLGGIAGAAVAWGVRRAVFASSNGLGEATFAAAAARTSHPAKQGLVQTFSIYIDVLLICMATGLMMVVSGKYNVADGSGGYLVNNLPGVPVGANWVQESIDTLVPGWGAGFVAVAVLLFGFTCLLAYFYVANSNLLYLLDGRPGQLWKNVLKIGTMAIVFFGSIVNAQIMWAAGDIGLGLIAWVNLICLVFLFPLVRRIHKDYERQRKLGQDPTFDPKALGIEGADFWEEKVPVEHHHHHLHHTSRSTERTSGTP